MMAIVFRKDIAEKSVHENASSSRAGIQGIAAVSDVSSSCAVIIEIFDRPLKVTTGFIPGVSFDAVKPPPHPSTRFRLDSVPEVIKVVACQSNVCREGYHFE